MFSRTSRWIAYPLCWLLLMLVPLVIDAWRAGAGATSDTNRFTITSFDGSYHEFRFRKHGQRCLRAAKWRFNRRLNLRSLPLN